MQESEVKIQMKKLWKATFHDTDEYIDLIFDNYFAIDHVEYEEADGKLVSALLGIPYKFGWQDEEFCAYYLCGLMTDDAYRCHGIMQRLIERSIVKAKRYDYTFCFLIPADDRLSKYYESRGFSKAFYRVESRYTSLHNFEKEYESLLVKKDERIRRLKLNYYNTLDFIKFEGIDDIPIDRIIDYIMSSEYTSQGLDIRHSRKDIDIIIKENIISNDLIYMTCNKNNDITCLALCEYSDDNTISIPHIFASDLCSRMKLLDGIKNAHKEYSLVLYDYPENVHRELIYDDYYIGPDNSSSSSVSEINSVYRMPDHAHSYGMVYLVDIDTVLRLASSLNRDKDVCVLIKEEGEEGGILYNLHYGKLYKEVLSNQDFECRLSNKLDSPLILSRRQLQDVICRKPDSSNIINEALGLVRLPLNICMMLD